MPYMQGSPRENLSNHKIQKKTDYSFPCQSHILANNGNWPQRRLPFRFPLKEKAGRRNDRGTLRADPKHEQQENTRNLLFFKLKRIFPEREKDERREWMGV